jgi:hypothetical protein
MVNHLEKGQIFAHTVSTKLLNVERERYYDLDIAYVTL